MRTILFACAWALVLIARLRWRRLGWWAGALTRSIGRLSRGAVRARYVYDVVGGPVLDPDAHSCAPYSHPPCGGCDSCCLAQAEYYGLPVHPVPVGVRS